MNEAVKFEVPQIQLSGKYKIQLFDKDTNKLIKEVEKHNIVSKIPFSAAFYNCIYNGIINNSFLGYNHSFDGGDYHKYNGLIGWMLLTSDDEAVSNDDLNPLISGEVIAFARYDYGYVGGNVKKGVYNANESYNVKNFYENSQRLKSVTKHIVYDFGTDKGNGTFDNIFILPSGSDSSNYPETPYIGDFYQNGTLIVASDGDYSTASYSDNQGDIGPISISDKYLYMQSLVLKKTGKKAFDKISKIDLNTYSIKYINLNVPTSTSSKWAYIIYACGLLWRIELNYNVTRYNLDGEYVDSFNLKNILTNKDLYDFKSSNYCCGQHFAGLTGDDENLYIYYSAKKENYIETYLCIIDKNFKLIKEVLINKYKKTDDISYYSINIAYINGEKYLIFSGSNFKKCFKIKNKNLIEKKMDCINTLANDMRTFYIDKKGTIFALGTAENKCFYGRSIGICHFVPWTSHCKLDSPVTKSSTNTMKIQYDITVDYIPPGSIENLK